MVDLRPEIQAFVRMCEHVLASLLGDAPLSADEREVVRYYVRELAAQVGGLA